MRRRIALFVALSVSAAAATGLGQEQLPGTLFSKCGAVRIEFILGRLTVIPQHRGQVRLTKPPQATEDLTESLFVNNDDASPVVRYQFTDERRTIELEIINYREVNLLVQRKQASGSVWTTEFRQPLQGDIEVRFSLDEPVHCQAIKAPTFWHLMLADRGELCEAELVPVLELLRPDWHIADLTERLETGLFQAALSQPLVSRRYLSELVAQLDSTQFQKRQTADSQLRSFGPCALPFLESLPRQNLSGEQRIRIDRIRRSIAGVATDTPERTAEWLGDDEQVWFALLKHNDPQRRHLATIRLNAMRSQSLEFDPYGDEKYRQEQLAELKSQIIRR
jgi:hypothetical protein